MSSLLDHKIRELRKQKGLSYEKLGAATSSSRSYLWELENREGVKPSAEKIAKIAEVLNVTTEYLLNDHQLTPDEEVADLAFFRKYQKLSASTKNKLRKILDAWDED